MANRPNYLLGYGERLTEPVEIRGGGGEKHPPYSFEQARSRLTGMLQATVRDLHALPESACPEGQTVASFTLHPEYFAKSHFPGGLLRWAGLRPVGSKARTVRPAQRSRDREPEEAVTTQLFVAGARSSFEALANSLPGWDEQVPVAKQLPAIEEIAAIRPLERVRPLSDDHDEVPLEIVLHASESQAERFILRGFQEFLEEQELQADLDRVFYAGRLCFLRMYASADQAEDIARYSFLRVLREMPKLRTTRPILRGKLPRPRTAKFPAEDAIDPNLRIAVFDGGINEASPLRAWVDMHDAPGVGAPEL